MDDAWIKALKPGDKVFVAQNRTKIVGVVERITPTGIVHLKDDRRTFSVKGRQRGWENIGGWGGPPRLAQWSKKAYAELRIESLRESVGRAVRDNADKMTAEELETIQAVIVAVQQRIKSGSGA